MKNRALRAIVIFFILMLAMTAVSRFADGVTVARVNVARVGSGALEHVAQARGIVTAGDAVPIWGTEGLRVSRILKNAGDSVKAGEALLLYDEGQLLEKLNSANTDLANLEARNNSQAELDMEADMLPKKRALADAELLYDKARGSKNKKEAQKKLDRAKEDLDVAERQWAEKLKTDEKEKAALTSEIFAAKETVMRLSALIAGGCALVSPTDATVASIDAVCGKTVGSESLLTLYDKSSPYKVTVQITNDEAKYVFALDTALVLPSGRRDWQKAQVESVVPAADGNCKATVILDGDYSINGSIDVKFSKKTDSYRQCVPLSAIYGDSSGDYVLTVADRKSVMGDEKVLVRVSVTVTDRDSKRAAISAPISDSDEVVVSSDKPVSGGSRVRVAG